MSGRIGRFHLVTDPNMPVTTAVHRAGLAAAAGVDAIHARYPHLAAKDLLHTVRALRQAMTEHHGTQILVNDRLDVAMATGADGVHLGQRSFDVRGAHRVAGAGMIVGVSVHNVGEAIAAAEGGADYVMFGHVHATASHPGEQGHGLKALGEVVEAVAPLPVIAIGGITAQRVAGALAAGAYGVAVIRAVLAAEDVTAAAMAIASALDPEAKPGVRAGGQQETIR